MQRVEWRPLEEFPDFLVSEHGDIQNNLTGVVRRVSINRQGIIKVTLIKDRIFCTRSVARLVASAFVPNGADPELFDTPIHKDGDKTNCRADNLAWRPRWFAVRYHKQFGFPDFHSIKGRFIDVESEEVYFSVKEICVVNGLWWGDVIKSIEEGVPVFPTWQIFQPLELEDGI